LYVHGSFVHFHYFCLDTLTKGYTMAKSVVCHCLESSICTSLVLLVCNEVYDVPHVL